MSDQLVRHSACVETPAEARLAELAEVIRREHAATMEAAGQVVIHAIACGEALIEAKTLVPLGQWGAWIERNIPHGKRQAMCRNYMRLAHHKQHVDPSLSITSNIFALTGLPARSIGVPRVAPAIKAKAMELIEAGELGTVEIAAQTGVTLDTIRAWRDPEYAKRKQDQANARRRERNIERGVVKALPSPDQDRAFRYGEPGRAAVTKAVRRLAQVQGKDAVREALLDLAAIATRWAERLGAPLQRREETRDAA